MASDPLTEHIARAICDAFWETAESPERWDTTGENKRQVFRNCARRAVAAGRQFKAAQPKAQAA